MHITCDLAAWKMNPKHRWVYDRLLIASTQSYYHGPIEIPPEIFPVIAKPITNLLGMGRGVSFIADNAQLEKVGPGNMWSEIFVGKHVSTDMVIEKGNIMWSAQAIGYKANPPSTRFLFWLLLDTAIEFEMSVISKWIKDNLSDYSGPMNIETIDGKLIEVHLRLSADWQDAGLYETPTKAIGIPVWQECDLTDLPNWAKTTGDDERPIRQAFIVVKGL